MQFYDWFRNFLGLETEPLDLTFVQISLRALLVFAAALVMVRIGSKRFLSRMTAFDVIVAFILGSILSRAVNGSAPLFPTLGAGFVLVFMHRLVGVAARHLHWFSVLVKGHSDLLIDHGVVQEKAMRRNDFSRQDLLEELRLQGRVESPADVERAVVERNGSVSVLLKSNSAGSGTDVRTRSYS